MGLFRVKNLSAQSEVLGMTSVFDVLSAGSVRSVFQPIVELDGGAVVAYEALARGPEGPLATPDALFAAAREAGLLAELDTACRTAAFRGALEQGLLAPLTVFVNVEPEVLDSAPLDDLLAIAGSAPGELRVVMEITERALSVRPADLLRTVERSASSGGRWRWTTSAPTRCRWRSWRCCVPMWSSSTCGWCRNAPVRTSRRS